MKQPFVVFQSTYSLLRSTITIERMLEYAKQEAIEHLVLADKNVLFGAIEFYQKARAAHVVPHIGMLLELDGFSALLIAKNNDGLHALQALSSEINRFDFTFTTALDVLGTIDDMVIVLAERDDAVIELLQSRKNNDLFMQKKARGETNLPRVDVPIINCLTAADEVILQTLYAIETNSERTQITTFPQAIFPTTEREPLLASFLTSTVDLLFDVYHLPVYSADTQANEMLFERLCKKGLQKRYGEEVEQRHLERLAYEMQIIKEMGFIDYFLIIWDVMRFARKADIIIGPGRGSAVGSIVAYVLGITKIDPLKYHLLFERFLNSARKTLPDIDIDVEDRRRHEIIAYLREKYGTQHVAHILTFGTFGAKSAIRDVGKAYNHKQEEINAILQQVTNSFQSIAENIAANPTLQKIIATHTSLAEIVRIAQTIEGFPRHSSTHAAGIILTAEPIQTFVATIEPEDNMLVTQATMAYCESLGLLKIDFLGLRNLTIIRQVAQQVMGGTSVVDFIEHEIPDDDAATFSMLSTGETTGIFQLESAGMRQVLQKFKINTFMDIATVISLYRPGPMQFINEYIARKDEKKQYAITLDIIAPLLEETFGIMVYQEQVMQIAQIVGQMNLSEADDFRRAMSKKDRVLLQEQRLKFLNGAREKGFPEDDVAALFDEIMAFASYGFNKSHAIAYATIAYQMAYLKVNYPAVFLVGLLNSVIQNETKSLQYLQEAQRFGLKILPVDINKSLGVYTVEDGNIRMGLGCIKSVGKITVQHILEVRTHGSFTDLADFLTRTEGKIVNTAVLEQLTNGYAFSTFSKNQKAIHTYLATHEAGRKFQGDVIQVETLISENIPDYTLEERREREKKAYGFSLFAHPLLHYPKNAYSLQRPPKNYLTYIVYIDKIHEITTKKGDKMAFATISDMKESTEVVIFPVIYAKFSLFLRTHAIVKVTLQLPRESEAQKAKLSVRNVEPVRALS